MTQHPTWSLYEFSRSLYTAIADALISKHGITGTCFIRGMYTQKVWITLSTKIIAQYVRKLKNRFSKCCTHLEALRNDCSLNITLNFFSFRAIIFMYSQRLDVVALTFTRCTTFTQPQMRKKISKRKILLIFLTILRSVSLIRATVISKLILAGLESRWRNLKF